MLMTFISDVPIHPLTFWSISLMICSSQMYFSLSCPYLSASLRMPRQSLSAIVALSVYRYSRRTSKHLMSSSSSTTYMYNKCQLLNIFSALDTLSCVVIIMQGLKFQTTNLEHVKLPTLIITDDVVIQGPFSLTRHPLDSQIQRLTCAKMYTFISNIA